MKILQVGSSDAIGSRFNGHDLHRTVRAQGLDSQYAVWEKQTEDAATWTFGDIPGGRWIDGGVRRIEAYFSLQSLLYPAPLALAADARFKAADVVHYHLLHSAHFSLAALPWLSKRKPSLWTLHDPWALTGHCIHPLDCTRWQIGCGQCPYLQEPKAMRKDHTALMWKLKRFVYAHSRIDLVVASQWMLRMVRESPLTAHLPVHHIPFGIDVDTFRPASAEAAKKRFGIPPGNLAIGFRSTLNPFKGLRQIKEALEHLKSDKPMTLLVFEGTGLLEDLRNRYQVVELGWVDDVDVSSAAYNAMDMFLMPSAAEAFGLMAIEAMACGKPVIVADGTALPEVVFAPEGGIRVPQGDARALSAAIASLLGDQPMRTALGARAAELAREHYDYRTYVKRTLDLYREVSARKSTTARPA